MTLFKAFFLYIFLSWWYLIEIPVRLSAEPGLNPPHFGNPFTLVLVFTSVRKMFFRIILTFLGGYFKYLRALPWCEVLEVGAVVF